ncbi:uncharacterized protein LOC121862392 [Homarus americanus]|uniref:uncharacterized protein LOC121862392 n=1 Tax=Homarus americanus TaxID=6706 RepID=UPI001C458573|nr:uncharacterized protein LOC121862392 [Homarus americanus]
MSELRLFVSLGLIAALVVAQLPFSTIPTISDVVKENGPNGRAAGLIRLWDFALERDGQGPAPVIRVNFEAKTILAPESIVLHSLIHQDAANPLYGSTPALAALRREFLLNHLVQEVLEFTDPRLNEKSGVKLLTFSGKDVTFTKDDQGQLFVNDVPAESESSYKDGTHIYILKGTLFDSKQKITKAFIRENSFNKELNGPTGPPLDIPNFDPVIRAPAPPPPGVVGPPAVPVIPSPPAPPPSAFREFVRAPAPPPPASSDVIIFPSRHGQVRSDV